MYTNIGKKIKILAIVVCCIGILASLIVAIVLFQANTRYYNTVGIGFAVLFGGSLISWIGSFFTYGFGELIDRTASIDKKLSGKGTSTDDYCSVQDKKRAEQLDSMLNEGLISREEYNDIISRSEKQ